MNDMVRRDVSGSIEGATPRPWRVFTSTDGRKLVGIGSEDGGGILDAGFGVWSWNDAEGIANAEMVVRAVNSHTDMLAALKTVQAMNFLKHGEESRIVAAAIAKAEGPSMSKLAHSNQEAIAIGSSSRPRSVWPR